MSPGVNLTVIAPTDAAFAALPSGVFVELLADATTAAGYMILPSGAGGITGIGYLQMQFTAGFRSLQTLASGRAMPFNLGLTDTGNVADASTISFGNATVVDTSGAFNGLLMVVDDVREVPFSSLKFIVLY